jgi:tellurite resistance protein
VKPSAHVKILMDALVAKLGDAEQAFIAAIDLAVLVALADGAIDASEKAALATSLEALMRCHVAPPVVRHLIRESKDQIEAVGPEARARAIGHQLADHEAADEGLRLALAIAFSSEGLCESERARIAQVAKAAGISDARFAALVTAAANPPAIDDPEVSAAGEGSPV